jgi:uncharacterized protein (TIGR03435 family)
MGMRIESGIIWIALTAALGQTAPPAWKEFSVGPPTANRTRFGPDGMRAEGVPFRRVLARAFGLPEHRIIGPAWIDDQRYAITALVNDQKDFQPLMQQELAMRWHMLAHREMKDVPVYELRSLDGAPIRPGTSGAVAGGRPAPSIRLNQQSVKAFADTMAEALGRPVFDETNLDGRFDFAFTWQSADPASLKTAVADQLGLNLVNTRRVVDLLIVDHIEKLP